MFDFLNNPWETDEQKRQKLNNSQTQTPFNGQQTPMTPRQMVEQTWDQSVAKQEAKEQAYKPMESMSTHDAVKYAWNKSLAEQEKKNKFTMESPKGNIDPFKKIFQTIDNYKLGATDNSLNDFRKLSQQSLNNLQNMTPDSFSSKNIKETYQDTINAFARGLLKPEKYDNLVGELTRMGYAFDDLSQKEASFANYSQYKHNYDDVYNYAKKQNQQDFQNSLQRSPVATISGHYAGTGVRLLNDARKELKKVFNRNSPNFSQNTGGQMRFTNEHLNPITFNEKEKNKQDDEDFIFYQYK